MSYSKSELKAAFESEETDFDVFLKGIKEAKKERKRIKDETYSFFLSDYIVREEEKEDIQTIVEFLEEYHNEYENHDNYDNAMEACDYDLDDDGVEYSRIVKYKDTFYKIVYFCEAEWCGDWSVRKNLPGTSTVMEIYEVLDATESFDEETDIITLVVNSKKELLNHNS